MNETKEVKSYESFVHNNYELLRHQKAIRDLKDKIKEEKNKK